MNKLHNRRRGFLLIELLVSLFIFSIVATVSIGSIVSIIDANRKNQSLKSVMNNLNLALDSITRYASVGYNYRCADSTTRLRVDCGQAGDSFGFTSPYDLDDNGDSPDEVTYTLGDGYIDRAIDDGLSVRITAPEVTISDLQFLVLGSEGNDTQQPKVFMFVSGSTVAGPRTPATQFKIQSVISQRLPDIGEL